MELQYNYNFQPGKSVVILTRRRVSQKNSLDFSIKLTKALQRNVIGSKPPVSPSQQERG
jgi:hypothetical protein